MNNFIKGSIFIFVCAVIPTQANEYLISQTESVEKIPDKSKASVEQEQEELPKHDLTEEFLYDFLLAEIAGQRGNVNFALDTYLDLAKRTKDPRVAKRATEIALYAKRIDLAIEAAKIWVQSQPEVAAANQTLIALLVSANQLENASPYMEKWLSTGSEARGEKFMQMGRLLARYPNKTTVLSLVTKLVQPYLNLPEAHFALAQAAANAEQYDKALSEIQEAAQLRPGWELAALFQAQLLKRQSAETMFGFFRNFLEGYPKAKEVRLGYGRGLVAEKRYGEARTEFQKLLKDFPENTEVIFAVGLLSVQLQDYPIAETSFKRLLNLDFKDRANVILYLGQIAEEQKKWKEALNWYSQIESGEHYLTAQIHYAQVLNKQGKLEEARSYLQQVSASSNADRIQLLLTEVQLLREADKYQEAFGLLQQAIDKQPNEPDLLYDSAMIAEKLDRMDVLETNLRKVIDIKPDHAHAYNALGYSLADRRLRLNEALGYVEKALKLSPQDAFIIDSMGWVHYRLGNLKLAEDYLRKAFQARPDPEIAAHLGEVLWKSGNKAEAEKIWEEALKKAPKNGTLLDTIKRFKAK